MRRSCDVVRGGIHCGRVAKVKAGLFVPPHLPVGYTYRCAEHYGQYVTGIELLGEPDLMIEKIDL